VRLVVETTTSFGGTEANVDEEKAEATGTMIDPSGLTVVSLSETDPSALMQHFMSAYGSDEMRFKVDSKITDIKLRFADGKEVPAKVVLRDKDLDLAFVRPEEELPEPAPAVDLAQSAVPQLADQLVTLSRLGDVGDWAISVGLDRITAIVEKPRTMYVPSGAGFMGGLGAPAFGLDGKLLGIMVLRSTPSRQGFGMFSGMDDLGMLPVILPAADVLEVAKQATALE